MEVVFSQLALLDLLKIYPEEHKRIQVKCAVVYYLKDNNAERRAIPVDAFPDKDMYVYPVDRCVVLYELLKGPRRIQVWSIEAASDEDSEV